MAVELFLGPLVKATISKLIDDASKQVSLAWGWKKDLIKFQDKMKMLQDVLQDADEKHAAGVPGLKAWLEKLRAVAEDAEDIFREVCYEVTRHKVASLRKEVSYHFTLFNSNPLVFRLRMANEVKNLTLDLAKINESAKQFELQVKLAAHTAAPEPRVSQTHSLPSYVIGRGVDVSAIISMLTDTSGDMENLSVTSVVGMGGLGKTTLAQKVRASDKICSHFGKIFWVCVSETFEVQRILREMLESLTRTTRAITNRDTLVQEIKQKLARGTYLLMLDDVWNEDSGKWEELRGCLLGISTELGNRVLVTTRNEKVARIMGTHSGHFHSLEGLEDDQCLDIIMKRAFGDHCSIPSRLTEIGRAIATKCRGVPLVASVIGGTLCNNFDVSEWLSIQNQIDATGSLGNECDARVKDILYLSLNRLPKPELKQCFVFCSIFPKDSVMEKDMLIQLWMAEGYLRPSGESSMEDIGGRFFEDLLAYSLFQEEERDSLGHVKSCKLHDLVHDLAQSITKGETVILDSGFPVEVSNQVRHLNLIGGVPTNLGNVVDQLRTLLDNGCSRSFMGKPRRLRALCFSDRDVEQLPLCLSELKCMSFLDISNTLIKELPETLSKLYGLQTFRYMNCNGLKGPPEGIEYLLNLQHIYFNQEELMPANLGRLTNLQTLQLFFVGEKTGYKVEELGSLSRLRGQLKIENLDRVKDKLEAERANLQGKAIEELTLGFKKGSGHDEEVLEGLRPSTYLKLLAITGYKGTNQPSWMSELTNLVRLKMERCRMLKYITQLGGLSSLQKIMIRNCNELCRIDAVVSNTPQLEELDISFCPKLESVSVQGLPYLQKLNISECKRLCSLGERLSISKGLKIFILSGLDTLRCIPSLDGLTSLKQLKICDCGLEDLSSSLSSCTTLECLEISGCNNLQCIPSMHGFTLLRGVEFRFCSRLKFLPEGLSSCNALERLSIKRCTSLIITQKELEKLESIFYLRIIDCLHPRNYPREDIYYPAAVYLADGS